MSAINQRQQKTWDWDNLDENVSGVPLPELACHANPGHHNSAASTYITFQLFTESSNK